MMSLISEICKKITTLQLFAIKNHHKHLSTNMSFYKLRMMTA